MGKLSGLAAQERTDLADFLETLSEEDWRQPSLCEGWSVRDVAAHVSAYDELSWLATMRLMASSGLSLSRANQTCIERSATLSDEELIARLRSHAVPRGVTALFGGAVALTDALLHHQDIRRALGRQRTVPKERLQAALGFAPMARALPAPANMRGLRVAATDLAWSHGKGAEVRGPGEALLVALAGRPQALDELEGSGVEVLTARLRPLPADPSA